MLGAQRIINGWVGRVSGLVRQVVAGWSGGSFDSVVAGSLPALRRVCATFRMPVVCAQWPARSRITGSCASTPSLVCGAKRLPHGPNRTAYWQLGARSGVLALRGQTSWHRWQQRSTSIIQRCLEPMASLTNLHIPFINSVGTRAHGEDGKETG